MHGLRAVLGISAALAGACSSGGSSATVDAGAGGGGTGGTGSAPAAKAGISFSLTSVSPAVAGKACTNATAISLPEPPLVPPSNSAIGDSLVDGAAGAEVTCSVTQVSGGYEISAAIRAGTTAVSLSATTDGTGTGTGPVTIVTSSATQSSDPASPCTFTGLQVKPGAFWGQFSCSAVFDAASSSSTYCALDAVVALQNCAN